MNCCVKTARALLVIMLAIQVFIPNFYSTSRRPPIHGVRHFWSFERLFFVGHFRIVHFYTAILPYILLFGIIVELPFQFRCDTDVLRNRVPFFFAAKTICHVHIKDMFQGFFFFENLNCIRLNRIHFQFKLIFITSP